jgi:DNA polymerase-4
MWGDGPKPAPKLRELGYATLGDLARARRIDLEQVLGTWGEQIQLLARGIDDRSVDPDAESKSIGAEETYEDDLTERADIERTLLDHSARVAQRMLREGFSARTVVVKLKYADFTLKSRRITLPEPVADTGSIYDAARALLDRFPLEYARIRLTGISVAELTEGPPPRTLFPNVAAEKRRKVEAVVASVADKFGGMGITRASLITRADCRARASERASERASASRRASQGLVVKVRGALIDARLRARSNTAATSSMSRSEAQRVTSTA